MEHHDRSEATEVVVGIGGSVIGLDGGQLNMGGNHFLYDLLGEGNALLRLMLKRMGLLGSIQLLAHLPDLSADLLFRHNRRGWTRRMLRRCRVVAREHRREGSGPPRSREIFVVDPLWGWLRSLRTTRGVRNSMRTGRRDRWVNGGCVLLSEVRNRSSWIGSFKAPLN